MNNVIYVFGLKIFQHLNKYASYLSLCNVLKIYANGLEDWLNALYYCHFLFYIEFYFFNKIIFFFSSLYLILWVVQIDTEFYEQFFLPEKDTPSVFFYNEKYIRKFFNNNN
jgi:hypothetical protein